MRRPPRREGGAPRRPRVPPPEAGVERPHYRQRFAPGIGPEPIPPAAPPPPEPPADALPLFVATKNPGKARELAAMLADAPFHVVGPELIGDLEAPAEDGATFEANARKKAIHYSRLVEHLVVADDSGLEVDALRGEPGVRSARLGGHAASDADRVRLILSKLEGVPWEERGARFRCVLAVARRGVVLETFEGVVEGRIAFEPAGAEGFGYDPIFFYEPAEMTFAEMTAVEKNRVSHRAQALERAAGWLADWARAKRR